MKVRKARLANNNLSVTVNPFVSEQQRRACYAQDDPNWDCQEWSKATKGKKLPKYKKPTKNARKPPSSLRLDPTRTTTIRRQFASYIHKRFSLLKAKVLKYVRDDDAFALKTNSEWKPVDIDVWDWLTTNCQPGQIRDEKGRCGPGIGIDIPREEMPQIPGDVLLRFITFANAHGVQCVRELRAISDLSPVQARFRQDRVDAIPEDKLHNPKTGDLGEPVITSQDDYVLDGTHRWIKAYQRMQKGYPRSYPNTMIATIRINLPLKEALALMKAFPGAKYATNANPFHNALGRFAEGVNEAADNSPTGKFGDNKTFISHVHEQYNKQAKAAGKMPQTLDQFKNNLNKARQAGLVKLSRADLPQLMNPKDLDASSLKHDTSEWHFVTRNSLSTNARDFEFHTSAAKIAEFQKWLKQQFRSTLTGKTDEELWEKYIQRGFEKGAGRAFDDTSPASKMKLPAGQDITDANSFYKGGKEAFLRSSFANPETVEKVKLLAGRTFDDLEGCTDDMATKLGRLLSDGLIEGRSSRDVGKDIADQIDVSENRAQVIARTEIIRAHAEGQLNAFEDMGVTEIGVQVEWSTAGDERVCIECASMEGAIYTVEDAHGMIPLHPQCRCAFLPYMEEWDKEDKEDIQRRKDEVNAELGVGVENAYRPTANRMARWVAKIDRARAALNVFCATGQGGGVDATCSVGGRSKFVGQTVGWRDRAHADKVEKDIASALGHEHESDYKFYDTRSKNNKEFVEVKTMLKGSKQLINAHPDALLRKVEGMSQNPGATFHTIVRDDRNIYEDGQHSENYSGHNLYYKRGNGRYNLSDMQPVKSVAELKRLVKMKDSDLPPKAQGKLPFKKEDIRTLRDQAAKASDSRKGRDANRRAKAKAEGRSVYERST